jgi:hypothetical protein
MTNEAEKNKEEAMKILNNILQTSKILEKIAPLVDTSFDDPNYEKYQLEYEELMNTLDIPIHDNFDILNTINQLDLDKPVVNQEVIDIINTHMEPEDKIHQEQKVLSQQELFDQLLNKSSKGK